MDIAETDLDRQVSRQSAERMKELAAVLERGFTQAKRHMDAVEIARHKFRADYRAAFGDAFFLHW